MKNGETIKLDNIWIDVMKFISKISNDESEKVKSMAESIKDINTALKSCERNKMLYTNALICSRFPEIIFAPNSGVIQVSREFMEDQPISVLSDSLMAIGIQLRNAIDAEKVIQAAKECGKIVVKRAIENYIQDTCGLYQK